MSTLALRVPGGRPTVRTTSDAPPLGRCPQLDGVRALAALAVITFHAWGDGLPGGAIGVDVFFVLSGFLITTLLLDEQASCGDISLARFYARRALRLFPPLAAMLVVTAVYAELVLPAPSTTITGVVAAATYSSDWLMAFHGAGVLGILYPTWSLAVEEQFYLAWPLLLMALLRLGGRRVLFIGALLGMAWVTVMRAAAVSHGVDFVRVDFAADMRADALLAGCALATARHLGWLDLLPPRVLRWAALLGLTTLAARAADPTFPFAYLPYGMTATALSSVLLIAGVLHGGRLAALLAHPWLVRIGTLSYAMYLWHSTLMSAVHRVLGDLPGPVGLIVVLLLTLAVAEASWRLVERCTVPQRARWERRAPVVAIAA